MRKLLQFLRGYEKECVLGPAFKLLEALLELIVPLVVKSMIDVGIPNGDKGYILRQCGILVLLALVGLGFSVTAQYFAAKAATGCSAKLRGSLFSHLQSLSYSQIDSLGTSTMITRMTSDVNQVQSGVNLALRLLLRSPFVVFGAMIMAFTIDVPAAMVFSVVIPVLLLVVFAIILVTIPMYRRVQTSLDGVTAATRENLTGVRVLRAFGQEDEEVSRFSGLNRVLNHLQLKVGRISNLLNPTTYVLLNLAVVALLYTGAIRVDSGILSQGQVVALYNYMSQILVELIKFANLIITMTKAVACGNRITGILGMSPAQKPGEMPMPESKRRGRVEFRDVSMAYHGTGDEAISGISFTANPGETIGIIGSTGSGKSTLVNLIPRFYDASRGQVLVDGMDVTTLDASILRERIGIVPQKAVLFRGTIGSNLLWGKENATIEEQNRALTLAQAMEIVESKEDGLDAPVEQGGRNLSGGQRQRLTIARALIRQPDILILDDSASALDYATDAALRKAISTMPQKPTTFIVSQRAASILHADRILVLEDGEVVGQGSHETLLRTCKVYEEIYHAQFRKEG
ncbi:MAG: ABC transporter ATP-binding protein [Ruminococcaceae bacterium]|nr:ABC transporter ATP-binding protein [Oscillospiraceae bacterium]